ncbi:MAG: Extracellular ribonuclease precursor [Candidatus Izimaplasma bacterium HR2]|nr:MAG: Extracellular ribonuclease precursor [Candidatus Izimaplasma bacterium HR2]
MIIKRFLYIFVLVLSIFTLASCNKPEVEDDIDDNPVIEDYTVIATTNVLSIIVEETEFLTNSGETQYEFIAPTHEDFLFLYWIDVDTEEVLSSELTYTFVASKDQSIEAIYELIALPVPTLFYETTFDEGSKASYAEGLITLSGESWTLSDALIGSLATDLKIEGNSVRIRDGYIQTEFSASDIAQVIFYAGTYGNDDDATVNFQISLDKTTWVTVDSFTSTATLVEYSYIFDEALFTSLSLDSDSAYYFRIESETVSRTNIDNFQIYTGVGIIGDDTPLYTISFDESMVNQYLLNETVDLTGCIATHTVAGGTTCDTTGTVDSSIAGSYEVIFSKTDEYGNTAVEIIRIIVIDTGSIDINMDLDSYYDDAEGLYGDALIEALNIILNTGFTGVTYDEVRYILDDSDVDPSNSDNIILVYRGTSISGVWDCSPSCTWNREHVWPQSLLGVSSVGDTANVASDLYNLMPANPGENSSRGNKAYSALGLGYEPRDDVKGDVARALFYMMVMYDNLTLVNTAPGIYEMGYLDELLAWHIADPVSPFELNRMEVIAAEQNNRNPFVDYPHLVDLIWFYDTSTE